MNLNFKKVTYEDELSEFSEEKLRELVGEFEDAQESNVAEFQEVADATEGISESEIEDFETFREELIEDITGAEAFDEVPLSEDQLESEDFSTLQEWKDFVSGQESESESDEDEQAETEFEDMGKKAPVDGGKDNAEFADDKLSDVQGLSL